MPTLTPRYISHLLDADHTNEFFRAIDDVLHDSLLYNLGNTQPDVDAIYVHQRLHYHTEREFKTLVGRLPSDIRDAIINSDGPAANIGYLEADFLDFIINYEENQVLVIRGSIGIGKSTFVRFLLNTVIPHYKGSSSHVPLLVDMFETGSHNPTFQNTLTVIRREIERRTHLLRYKDDVPIPTDGADGNLEKEDPSAIVEYLSQFAKRVEGVRPFVVFDNLDHLDLEVVFSLCGLARGIFRATGMPVVLALRDTTHAEVVAHLKDRNTFYQFRIELPPPDLRQVVHRRLVKAFKNQRRITARNGATIAFNSSRAIKSISETILKEDLQADFLRGVCANNVRTALRGFVYFLRYHNLDYSLIFGLPISNDRPQSHEIDNARHPHYTSMQQHFFVGLLEGPRLTYKDESGSPITNVFVTHADGAAANFTITFRLLSYLGFVNKLTSQAEVRAALYYHHPHIESLDSALGKLLERQLIYSPETDFILSRAKNIRLSHAGRYYLEHLIKNRDYLYRIIYDIPLPHAAWRRGAHDSFRMRMNSVLEYLEAVTSAEENELNSLRKSSGHERIKSVIKSQGLLSTCIMSLADEICAGGQHSRDTAVTRAAAEYRSRLEAYRSNVLNLQESITSYLGDVNAGGRSMLPGADEFMMTGSDLELVAVAPQKLSADSANTCRVSLNLAEIEAVEDLTESVVLLWELEGGGKAKKLVPLRRSSSSCRYSGEVTFDHHDEPVDFPSSRLSLYCGPELAWKTQIRKRR